MSAFSPKRRTFRFCQTNLAPPETVFPLLCPVREADWLDGWRFTMMYSESGLAEKGCVFRTSSVDAKDTFWVITRYSREEHEIVFARYAPDSVVCLLEIVLEPDGADRSKVYIAYTYTAIAPEGNPWIDNLTEEDFLITMRFWRRWVFRPAKSRRSGRRHGMHRLNPRTGRNEIDLPGRRPDAACPRGAGRPPGVKAPRSLESI